MGTFCTSFSLSALTDLFVTRYLSSCTMQGIAPNPIQMLTFMYSADVVLEMPLNIGRFANYVLGNWVGWLGGYKSQYFAFAER
jgi:hypothetical protein